MPQFSYDQLHETAMQLVEQGDTSFTAFMRKNDFRDVRFSISINSKNLEIGCYQSQKAPLPDVERARCPLPMPSDLVLHDDEPQSMAMPWPFSLINTVLPKLAGRKLRELSLSLSHVCLLSLHLSVSDNASWPDVERVVVIADDLCHAPSFIGAGLVFRGVQSIVIDMSNIHVSPSALPHYNQWMADFAMRCIYLGSGPSVLNNWEVRNALLQEGDGITLPFAGGRCHLWDPLPDGRVNVSFSDVYLQLVQDLSWQPTMDT